jgi:CHASE2 domain-containing sensor protein
VNRSTEEAKEHRQSAERDVQEISVAVESMRFVQVFDGERSRTMRQLVFATAAFISLAIAAVAQSQDSKYQLGTVVAVKAHDSAGSHDDTIAYDLTIRVGKTDYMILYTPPSGSRGVKFAQGYQVLVRVEGKTLGFRDMMGRYLESPILGTRTVTDTSSPDSR